MLNSTDKREYLEVFTITNFENDEEIERICEELANGRLFIQKRYPVIQAPERGVWTYDPLNDRSWRFWLHCLITVEYLVVGHEKLKKKQFLDKALEQILDWYDYHLLSPGNKLSEMAWHDHSTALRLLVISHFYEEWRKENFDPDIAEKLHAMVEVHCEKLVDPVFYMNKHNHGLDQDIALYVGTTVFSEMKKSKEWNEFAFSRMLVQISDLFADDGSYLEHSPNYTYLLLDRLFNFAKFLFQIKDQRTEIVVKKLEKILHHYNNMLYPNGFIPTIGDSEYVQSSNFQQFLGISSKLDQYLGNLDYITSLNESGTQPAELDAVYPQGGFAVSRNKWAFDDETVQVIFYSGFHSRVHKHSDDLSINIFAHQQPILTDPGKFNYDYESTERKYVVSSRAHNTVIVDSKDTETVRLNVEKSGITNFYSSEEITVATGVHCLYVGVIHSRTIIHLKPFECIILDDLQGHKDHTFEQNFVLNPNINCHLSEGAVIGELEEQPCITISPLINKGTIESKLIKGSKDPLEGWVSTGYSNLVETFSSRFVQKGKNARFATRINLKPNETRMKDFTWEGDVASFSYVSEDGDLSNVKLIFSGKRVFVSVNNQLFEPQYFKKDTINDAMDVAEKYEFREKYRKERNRRIKLQEELEIMNDRLEPLEENKKSNDS
ncbi:heparinase II/III domain-containing protein [Alkalihalobacterium sp. APHAB7]|uniref:heparinase II/III domain-containing protein n=1 Tax=Alkalihalobacterium sp. APHAB7 TaxID=3402081 RepID=UPI003AABA6EF